MFDITGRILTINYISEKSAQVVIKKQVRGKQVAIAINIFGFWLEKMKQLKLQKNEKIEGKVFVKSNLYKNKWYTDLYFCEVHRWIKKPKWNETPEEPKENKTQTEIPIIHFYDEETGEILL